MFVNKASKVEPTPSSPVNTMHPDILQLSLTIQQVSSQLNLMLSQQHLEQKSSDRSTDTRQDFADLPTAPYPEQQGRSCHHASPIQPNLFRSASHMLTPCIRHCQYHHHHNQQKAAAPISASTSFSLLTSMNSPMGCPHNHIPWHQHNHYGHPHHTYPYSDTFQSYPCLHSMPCSCQGQQPHYHQQHCQRHFNQHVTNTCPNPRSMRTTPGTPTETKSPHCSMPTATPSTESMDDPQLTNSSTSSPSSSPRTIQSTAPPAPILKNEVPCDVQQDPPPRTEIAWTGTCRQDHTIHPNKTRVKHGKKDSLIRDWWLYGKTRWHQFRNKSVAPQV